MTIDSTEALPTVVDTRGAWDLNGTRFIGDVRVLTEEGKLKWLSGEHGKLDYNWDGHWNP